MPGGRIAPDGRTPQTPGVGKKAKRHDLERQPTPGLHDSDLQSGDVQALEQGLRVAPRTTQPPARPDARRVAPQGGAPTGQQGQVPDPMEFLGGKLGGTFQKVGVPRRNPRKPIDVEAWMPLIQTLATSPGGSGILGQAFITQMGNLARKAQTYETPLIDMQDADDDLDAFLNG